MPDENNENSYKTVDIRSTDLRMSLALLIILSILFGLVVLMVNRSFVMTVKHRLILKTLALIVGVLDILTILILAVLILAVSILVLLILAILNNLPILPMLTILVILSILPMSLF